MKISLLQSDLHWQAAAVNRQLFSSMIQAAPRSDIYLLPEMFTTGFVQKPEDVAENAGGPTLEWMLDMAARYQGAVAGSVVVREGARHYNRFYFAAPDGTHHAYDKRHLFTMGGEKEHFSAGTGRLVFEYGGFRVMPSICYDLRFPVFSRAAGQVDLMLCVASWPAPRISAWDTLLRARAIENQCYVAGVNRVGEDPDNSYNGHSAVIDYLGDTLAGWSAAEQPEEPEREAVFTADLSREKLDAFRTKFPAWMDADQFRLI